MGRKYYRKSYRGSRDKYSVEQNGGSLVLGATGNGGVTVVPPATTQGMRKVKHLTLNMANVANTSAASTSLYWALVYVPQGTNANTLQLDSGSTLYEPNQFVMSCGVFDFDGGPLRIHCPISRNLNSGDSIALVCYGTASQAFNYVVRYAVTLQ